MRKGWMLLVAFWACAGTAYAGPYSDAVRAQEMCRTVGKMGAVAYQARPASAPQMSSDQLHDAAAAWLAQVNAIRPIPGGTQGRILRRTVDHAFMRAPSEKDAFEYGWAKCMDEYGPQ